MTRTVGILGALESEVRHIYNTLKNSNMHTEAGLHICEGTLGRVRVIATTAGMGTVNAAAATQLLISRFHADTVIFSGIAGSLNPSLHIDDVVIGGCLRYIDTDNELIAESSPALLEYTSSAVLVQLAQDVLRAKGYTKLDERCIPQGRNTVSDENSTRHYLCGTIATGNRFITGASARARVIAATKADCAEMEGTAVAHITAKNGVDCLVLRAISDNCDEAYDTFCERSFDLERYARRASEVVVDIVMRLDRESSHEQ